MSEKNTGQISHMYCKSSKYYEMNFAFFILKNEEITVKVMLVVFICTYSKI